MFETSLLVWLWYNVSVVWLGEFLAYLSSVMVTEGSKWHSALGQKRQIPTGELLGLHGSCGRHMENLLMCCKVTGICKLFAGSSDCFSLQTQELHRENKPGNISVTHRSLQHRRGLHLPVTQLSQILIGLWLTVVSLLLWENWDLSQMCAKPYVS